MGIAIVVLTNSIVKMTFAIKNVRYRTGILNSTEFAVTLPNPAQNKFEKPVF